MNLATLQGLDQRTAEGVLAAAALATSPDPGMADPLRQYSLQAAELLAEIRHHLRIKPDDTSPRSKYAIDNFLAEALRQSILGPGTNTEALKRVGQSGRLAPALYRVVQPNGFADLFYGLGVKANHVDDAVRRPDDYQHLMTEALVGTPEEKTISLFMKRVNSRDQRNRHWLLVQTHRTGTDQIAQAAWRLYPSEIDLSQAATPLDALKAFVNVFGCPIKIGDKKTLFIESDTFPCDTEVKLSWSEAPPEHFWSISVLRDRAKRVFLVGTAYVINISQYRDMLRAHGVQVREPGPRPIAPAFPRKEVRVFVNDEKLTIVGPRLA
jgi:hypothetical protein